MKAYIAYHKKETDSEFDATICTEDTPAHIARYIFFKCESQDKADKKGKSFECEGLSVSSIIVIYVNS